LRERSNLTRASWSRGSSSLARFLIGTRPEEAMGVIKAIAANSKSAELLQI
jgi:hypothetical protein